MTDHKRHLHGLASAFQPTEQAITTPSEYDELRAQIRRNTTRLLAQLIDAQLDMAIPDCDLEVALADYGMVGEANAHDLYNEVWYTCWAVIRSLEALTKALHQTDEGWW